MPDKKLSYADFANQLLQGKFANLLEPNADVSTADTPLPQPADPMQALGKASTIGAPQGDWTPLQTPGEAQSIIGAIRALLGNAKRGPQGEYITNDTSAVAGLGAGIETPFDPISSFQGAIRKAKGGGLEFNAQTLKNMEAAIKSGGDLGKQWKPLSNFLQAFNGDMDAARMFARMWGATSPNTPVARTNYEAIQAWNKLLKGDIPFTPESARAADLTMVNAKVPNLNKALNMTPLQGGKGEMGKTEAMSRLAVGDPDSYTTPTIPVDIHAIDVTGGPEQNVQQLYRQVRNALGGEKGQFSYTDLYNQVADLYRKGLAKFGSDFPTMWEGMKMLKGQGQSAGLTSWLEKWGLLKPGAMFNPEAMEHVIQNVDRSEFYGKGGTASIQVPEPWVPKLSPREVANLYAKEKGFPSPDPHSPVKVDQKFAMKVADVYDKLEHNPNDPKVQAAYAKLRDEISDQFEYITQRGGLKAEPWTQSGQPYANSAEMIKDVTENHHMFYFPTEGGFGSSGDPSGHPLLARGKSGLPANDELRVVHDYLAHALGGHQFGPSGEENAFLEHAKLLSPEARTALATETRGQNSWVNFGPHLRTPEGGIPKKGEIGFISPQDRPFAPQKAALMPDELSGLVGKIQEMLGLEHRSPQTNLTEIDPAHYGSAFAGEERSRATDPDFIKRSYFSIPGTPIEARLKNLPGVYQAQVAKETVYPISTDPLGIVQKAQEMSKGDDKRVRTLFEKLVREAGFKGYTDGRSVAYFEKVPVTR